MTILERLTPEQRVAYVLRVAFDLDYEEIADGHAPQSASRPRDARKERSPRGCLS